jgi:hypothetical protein
LLFEAAAAAKSLKSGLSDKRLFISKILYSG